MSSILTPFALGAVVGGIASLRVPVGNAQGDLVTSWLNPTSILIGVLAVVTAAYLAAVYLAADAVRLGRPDLAAAFRARALITAVVAGAVAVGGLAVVRNDAEHLWDWADERCRSRRRRRSPCLPAVRRWRSSGSVASRRRG